MVLKGYKSYNIIQEGKGNPKKTGKDKDHDKRIREYKN